MEVQIKDNLDNNHFDFNKKSEEVVYNKEPLNPNIRKKIKHISFLVIGSVVVGMSLGVTNMILKSVTLYSQTQAESDKISDKIRVENEERRKNNQLEIEQINQREKIILALKKSKEEQEVNIAKELKNNLDYIQQEKIILENDKVDYALLLKNKDDMVANYEAQLRIYDKVYQNANQNVHDSLVALDKLNNVREYYTNYKTDITQWSNFLQESTVSFEKYHSLDKELKHELWTETINYQTGKLRRNIDLENALVSNLDPVKDESKNLAESRVNSRNKMIWDLADILKANNDAVKIKKFKR